MNYVVQDTSLTAVADAIRKQTKSTEQISFPNGFVSEIGKIDAESSYNNGYQQGYTEGEAKGDEQGYNRGYDEGYTEGYTKTPLQYTTNLNMTFLSAVFPKNCDLVIYVPNFARSLSSTFSMSKNLKTVKLVCDDTSGTFDSDNSFYNCQTLETIDLTEFKKKLYYGSLTFTNCYCLQEIKGELDYSECASSSIAAFGNVWALKEVRFKQGTVKVSLNISSTSVLTDKSIQSIIDGLADMNDGEAQTLTLHADVKAKLTDEQLTTIFNKNWDVV